MQRILAAVAAMAVLPATAWASLVDGPAFATLALPPQMFTTGEDGTVNPSFTFMAVSGYGTVTVSYGPYFQGQSASSFFTPPTSVSGTPTSPLTLVTSFDSTGTDPTSYKTVVEFDASSMQEELGGVPAPADFGFGGPIAIEFSAPVYGVTLTAGSFDQVGSATIAAFTADGTSLGTVGNTQLGFETFNLRDSGGGAFSGVLITGTDLAGFAIDGVGIAAAPTAVELPAPSATALLPALLLLVRRRTSLVAEP